MSLEAAKEAAPYLWLARDEGEVVVVCRRLCQVVSWLGWWGWRRGRTALQSWDHLLCLHLAMG